ncbi:23606_t:CDS:1, partial [Gigaspora rosea]
DCENELPHHSTTISTESNKKYSDKEFKEAKRVMKLLNLFPPPCTAEQFFHKNPPSPPDDKGKVKRPCNKFIIFRKVAHDQKKETSKLMNFNERTFSKYIGIIWDHLVTSDEKNHYTKLASKVKELHKAKYPSYKYKPKRDKATWKQYSPSSNQKKQNRKTKSQPVYSQIDDINTNVQQIQSTQGVYNFELPVVEFNNQNQYIVPDNIQNQYIDSDNIQNQYIASNDIQDDNIQYTNNYFFNYL